MSNGYENERASLIGRNWQSEKSPNISFLSTTTTPKKKKIQKKKNREEVKQQQIPKKKYRLYPLRIRKFEDA